MTRSTRSANGLRARRILGKYRLVRRLDSGGFCEVWQAYDRVENISVALKVPLSGTLDDGNMRRFQREARLTASLDHPNVARLKNAEFIDGLLVATFPLGKESLGDRLTRRIGTKLALEIAEDLLEALAYAHRRGVIHLDVKPENILLFQHGRARLADFGISKVAASTMCSGSGLGTVGYYAPEQAFGRPGRRSDVFSAGLVIWRMLSGTLPTWPFGWPAPGVERVETKAGTEMVRLLRRAMRLDAKHRFDNAGDMLVAYRKARRKLERQKSRTNGAG